jgi:hypothetical protein
MILDAAQQFSSAQNLAQAAGTYASSNVLDYGITSGIPSSAAGGGARDMGVGDRPALKLFVSVVTTFTSGGAGTLAVAVQGAPDDGSGGVGAFTTWWTSPAYALATLNAGSRLLDIDFPRPPDGIAIPRFVRLLYTVAVATFTAGTLNAYVVLDREDYNYQGTDNSIRGGYPAGLTVAN